MRVFTVFSFMAVVPFIIGCGPARPPEMPATVPCTVTVLDGGTPLQGVAVTLRFDELSSSLLVEGTTDASGVAQIKTTWGNYTAKGAPVGTCKVAVDKYFEIPPNTISEEESEKWTMEQATRHLKEREELIDSLRIIPKEISNTSTTPLSMTVEASGGSLTVDVSEYKK